MSAAGGIGCGMLDVGRWMFRAFGMKAARVTLSDRASAGIYEDRSGPEIERILAEQLAEPIEWVRVLIPDERSEIEATLRGLCDSGRCDLVVTTGGTGPAPRDVTPEATRAVLER